MKEQYPPVLHPMVRKHPETGRKTLFVNSLFTTHIPDMDPVEGNDLLNLLFAQVKVPDFQCRFKWAPNSIAFWDNRATQHYAASDYFPHRRVMERVASWGTCPSDLLLRNADDAPEADVAGRGLLGFALPRGGGAVSQAVVRCTQM